MLKAIALAAIERLKEPSTYAGLGAIVGGGAVFGVSDDVYTKGIAFAVAGFGFLAAIINERSRK